MSSDIDLICPLCETYKAKFVGTRNANKAKHDYYKCTHCELIFAPIIPTVEQFTEAYKGGFTVRSIARKTLKLAPVIALQKLKRAWSKNSKPIKFLDIGSNAGYFTEAARRLGCDAHGIELNAEAVEFARQQYPQCHFYNEPIESFSKKGQRFDFIYCSEVIEHVPDVHSFVKAMQAVSHSKTILFITTPDSGHFKVPKELINWHEIIAVEHLRLFNKKNLRTLLNTYGFDYSLSYPMLRANQRHFCKRIK